MTAIADLAIALKRAYESAPENRKVASIHLFGIAHHATLAGLNKHDLAEKAGLPRSYGAELHKAAVLGDYVEIVKPLV